MEGVMKHITRFVTVCVLSLVFAIQVSIAEPSATTAAPKAVEWEKKWDDTVAAAKKEGELLIYLNAPSEARTVIPDAFKKKYGITLGVISGAGADLASRLVTEYRSGIHQVDVFSGGANSAMIAKVQGFLSPIAPMLIQPEIISPKAWHSQKLPMYDKDGMVLYFLLQVVPPVVYNTNMVKPGQIGSYLDLLKAEWKGKMVMYDPTTNGAAASWMAQLSQELGAEKVNQFLTALVKQQEVIVTREMGQQIEWVMRGKYPLALFPQTPAVSQYLNAGAPIAAASFKEFIHTGSSNGGLAIPKYPAHPNATVVFLNWLLSKEGQNVAVKSMGLPSARSDVLPEGVDPMFVLKAGQKFTFPSDEVNQKMLKWKEEWIKIFAQTRG